MTPTLPIDAIRKEVLAHPQGARLVLSSPTGSGKSTQVPRWFSERGPVLVVEPRRVACRSLALRISELEGSSPGERVGYVVRDDRKATDNTQIVFATPGVVLRMVRNGDHGRFQTLIIDEFHERSLDTDLLMALFHRDAKQTLIVMSATLDGDRVAKHLGGLHVHAPGRVHPVTTHYLGSLNNPPSDQDLENRVSLAVQKAEKNPGDILVFLPGKGEISAVESRLKNRSDLTVLPLHGGLSLSEQGRIFEKANKKKVILSTNVAETSLTVPGVGVVIDSGLVRQTRYYRGRGFLSLVSVARDSADQRSGRAGRTGPGVCYRLWSEAAKLEAVTRPEIHREGLVPLVLSAAACGEKVDSLPLLDPPKPYAVESAMEELTALGALEEAGGLSAIGHELFQLPIDAHLGRLLVEARGTESMEDVCDLIGAIGVGRPLFLPGRRPEEEDKDLRACGSDVVAWIRALRIGNAQDHGLNRYALGEARRIANRLRSAFGCSALNQNDPAIDVRRLALLAMVADRRCVHVARRRKRAVGWSSGSTEITLARESAVVEEKTEAIAVFESRAVTTGKGDTMVIATCALPLPLPWLVQAELGQEQVASTQIKKGKVIAIVERSYAKKVIGKKETVPSGKLAREAFAELLLRGSLFHKTIDKTRLQIARWNLAARLAESERITVYTTLHRVPVFDD